jgi:hypothetical protein
MEFAQSEGWKSWHQHAHDLFQLVRQDVELMQSRICRGHAAKPDTRQAVWPNTFVAGVR